VGAGVLSPAARQGQGPSRRGAIFGRQWIRIVYRCWVNHTPYDEQIYLKSLRLHGSPLAAAIAKAAA